MKKWFKIILISLPIILIGGILWIGYQMSDFDYFTDPPQIKFDKNEWSKKVDSDADCIRPAMLTDIFENHVKNGMSANDVKKILGKPEKKLENGFAYNLGLYKSPFDPSELRFEIDENGKVQKITVETH